MNGTSETSRKLYALTAEHLTGCGEEMPCTMDALLVYASGGRYEIDGLALGNLDNNSFCQAVYICAFDVPPPEHYLAQWSERAETLSREAFQRELLEWFVRLPDFQKLHVHLVNGIQMEQKKKKYACKTSFAQMIYQTALPVYLRLPMGLRQRLKKTLRPLFFR